MTTRTETSQHAAVDEATPDQLYRRLKQVRKQRTRISWLLLSPAIAFLLAAFILPIAAILYFSIAGSDILRLIPLTIHELDHWSGTDLPDDAAFTAMVEDLKQNGGAQTTAALAQELNYRLPGFRSIILRAGRAAAQWPASAGRPDLIALDPVWGDGDHWRAIKSASAPLTSFFILAALDLRSTWDDGIQWMPDDRQIYLSYLGRTFWMCLVVTALCLVIGYPLAHFIASSSGRITRVLLLLLLLPFWTSILVRTAAWVIILQQNGIVNSFLQDAQITDRPLALIYNRFGVYIVMTHVLLPFMVLPIYSVMRGIPKNLISAAASLGARPLVAFVRVYLPQSLPGLAAGVLMTYVLALGYYVTPALVGGAGDQMDAYLIARFALGEAHWSMAAALAVVLLACVATIYFVCSRFARIDRLQLG